MHVIKNHFSMYANLPKEMYVLAFGRIMTSMGSLIWPMLTLIMSEKLGLSGQMIGLYMMVFALIMIPCNLIGGKLADRFNKKHIIVTFDLIGNSLYLICAFIPISMNTLYIMAFASVLQQMEHPSYDALVADLTPTSQRQNAYSLNYLAFNLGLVLAPTIGGMLFNNYLNFAFLINGLADLSSTLLILFFIKNISYHHDEEAENSYEKGENGSLISVLRKRKLLIMLFAMSGISSLIYAQFNFLMPLHMEAAFVGTGAFKFGILTSINGLVVIIGTPIITKKFNQLMDVSLMFIGQLLEVLGLACFIFLNHYFIVAIVGMIIFTTGEVFLAISTTPYLTKRIPSTHRGRILGLMNLITGLVGSLGNYGIGILVDNYSFTFIWQFIAFIGGLLMLAYIVYIKIDHLVYSGLYQKGNE